MKKGQPTQRFPCCPQTPFVTTPLKREPTSGCPPLPLPRHPSFATKWLGDCHWATPQNTPPVPRGHSPVLTDKRPPRERSDTTEPIALERKVCWETKGAGFEGEKAENGLTLSTDCGGLPRDHSGKTRMRRRLRRPERRSDLMGGVLAA